MTGNRVEFFDLYFQPSEIKFPKVLTFTNLFSMPLEKLVLEPARAWALWRISEDESTLTERLDGIENISDTISNGLKRLEWLAGRVLVKELFSSMSLTFQGITKDVHGKPSPAGYDYHMSLTHSFPFVAALVDKHGPAGIDLEQPKHKLLRIAPRVLHAEELEDAGQDITKHCVYWCAKESMIKFHGRKDLVLADNLRVHPFELSEEGDIRGRIIVSNTERMVPLHYIVSAHFVLVFNQTAVL
jgi:4'-phosphopantetheinyl transferase